MSEARNVERGFTGEKRAVLDAKPLEDLHSWQLSTHPGSYSVTVQTLR